MLHPLFHQLKPRNSSSDASAVTRIWTVTLIFFGSTMLAGGVARVAMPWMRKDIERYLKRFEALFETAIDAVVVIAAAEAIKSRPSVPLARDQRPGTRSGGAPRPGQKPGASRSRQRSRTRR